MGGLLADAQKSGVDAVLTGEIHSSLATATEEWMAETESSRQHFRLLAEQTKQDGLASLATDQQKNLEAVIRLELMDLSELKGLALPRQCKQCSNSSDKCRAQRASACKNPGNKPSQEARAKISEEKKQGAGKSSRQGTGS